MAQDFTIEYHRTFKVLNNLRSGKTYEDAEKTAFARFPRLHCMFLSPLARFSILIARNS